MKIFKNMVELIGNTPLVELSNYSENNKLNTKLIAKVEYFNPGGSVKDRVGYYMIKDAEEKGIINKDTVIIEPTSGNTGVGLALTAAIKGYRLIIIMPESMSMERRKTLTAYGAELILTPADKGMKGAIEKANELAKEISNSFIAGQFDNPANARAHRETTAEEIWNDTEGKIDIFVAGIGTGGTITGVGEGLKKKNPNVKIIAVEPKNSAVVLGEKAGQHKIQGIGAGFIPEVLNVDIIDEIIKISDDDAFKATKELVETEGVFVGISSGAAVEAAKIVGKREENRGKNIIVLLPDTGLRYLSTSVFD
ncbi:cysteine synthase A [Clostridium botulinum]|uniref:Cysteine synthase n=1 Tax=Clostridium botulinum C/D str. DC5 TaxID=1443128 RepID=A0A0A0IDA7_CLOBO|nr:cysteine synthase A [Clostridium botulinum]KEI00342.1 cysteine synthase [Clostridium botulinum C/D str. BKT75002]KEI08963.1 cysteine synthase [Clostridium botulinum C/D str. BKT2873]KGM95980.1 cysteine synthase [Clostridium botulinum D str. CCUG 7971]KGM99434.1 cysteine synthase [Clostridium botulinum C/D str. DC5]KOC49068.1 cysteine synthase [Clostridium botulinum]